ncbi:MAG TPA: alpha-amylase family glycosyl hydrolase [Rubricoccaceae bacterium]|nr:alpha-amylase family glycosyl hydrolase [Rubricoccaceae bacterium]
MKDARLRDNPLNPEWEEGHLPYHRLLPAFSTDQPEVHALAAEMRRIADGYDGRVLIGEIYLPIEQLVTYYGQEDPGVHLPFNFQLITLPWDAREIDAAVRAYEGALPGGAWPNWVLSNHDKSRIATRVGRAQARVAAVLLLTLRGTPTMYYGDELGLEDVPLTEGQMRDPQGLRLSLAFSRDPQRAPMPWDASAGGGFTTGTPWLPLHPDYETRNVEAQRGDPASMLAFYRRLLALRRERRALTAGLYTPHPADGDAMAYLREVADPASGDDRLLVALNLGAEPQTLDLEDHVGVVLLGTHAEREGERVGGRLTLHPNEALIAELD